MLIFLLVTPRRLMVLMMVIVVVVVVMVVVVMCFCACMYVSVQMERGVFISLCVSLFRQSGSAGQ